MLIQRWEVESEMAEHLPGAAERRVEMRYWMRSFAGVTFGAAVCVVALFGVLLWMAGDAGTSWMRVDQWERVAPGVALLALPVAFAGSVVVIKIAQLATTVADNQRELLETQNQLVATFNERQNELVAASNRLQESQVRLQAHQVLHDDLAVAGEYAGAVVAWRMAWRRALNQFWDGLTEAAAKPPSAPRPKPRSARPEDDDLFLAGADADDALAAHEQSTEKWRAATAAARTRVVESLRTLRRLAHEAERIAGLDACVRENLQGSAFPFAVFSFRRPVPESSSEDDFSSRSAPARLSDLLPDRDKLLHRLAHWWLKGMGDEQCEEDQGGSVISLAWSARAADEHEWEEDVPRTFLPLLRLFGPDGLLRVSLLAAVADCPEEFVIAATPHAPENAARVAERVHALLARAQIDDPLHPDIGDWVSSVVQYVRSDPRRISGLPQSEWDAATTEWASLLSAEACRIIANMQAGRG